MIARGPWTELVSLSAWESLQSLLQDEVMQARASALACVEKGEFHKATIAEGGVLALERVLRRIRESVKSEVSTTHARTRSEISPSPSIS